MAEQLTEYFIAGTTYEYDFHAPTRIDGHEYCSECDSWQDGKCTRNPNAVIIDAAVMPGCRFFTTE